MRLTGNGDGFQAPANAEERSKQVGVGIRASEWNSRRRASDERQSARTKQPMPTPNQQQNGPRRYERPGHGSQELEL